MRPKDIYVHADIQGASSVIIRNTTGEEIPPKTLLEAGTMAISYSVAWDAKVVTNSYWVYSHQVSKTAPTGEYLGTGSFMIRGKKNFLPSCHLIMGLSLLFKLEDSFVQRHAGERKIRTTEDINGDTIEQPEISTTDLNEINEACEPINEYGKNSFPNTEVKIEHDTGRITFKTDLSDEIIKTDAADLQSQDIINNEETVIIKPAPSRKKNQSTKKRREGKERSEKANIEMLNVVSAETEANSSKVKRGQKGKLKKMKLKYRDQDDEERKIRMMILNSSGKDKPIANTERQDEKPSSLTKTPPVEASENIVKNQVEIEDIDDSPIIVDTDLLDSLTGVPFDDDELLFAIPVVAPYQALQQYK